MPRQAGDFTYVATEGVSAHELALLPSVQCLKYPAEILALAEEIADASDVLGIESTRLDFLIRAVLYVDRLTRP
jgi:hypothetical protein